MRRDLPPLNALRAFEAAARRLSFTRAAAELNVTQAAVSHQIRALEEHLGRPLFRRLTRGLALTDAGQRLLQASRTAFDAIAEATAEIRPAEDGRRLTISVLTSFAAKWLVPRLSAFRKLHPEIDTWLLASDSCIDFSEGDGEIGIRYGPGTYAGLCADLLMPGDVIAVCSPALLEGPHPLTGPEALRHHTLIHDEIPVEFDLVDWPKWLKAAGIGGIDGRAGPRYSHLNMALDAALQGDGVVLVKRVLVEDELASGRLLAPFDLTTHESFAYYLVYPEDHLRMPKVAAFRDWILGITARHRVEDACEPRMSA